MRAFEKISVNNECTRKVFYDKISLSKEIFYYGKQKEKRVQTKTNDRGKKKYHSGSTAGIRH